MPLIEINVWKDTTRWSKVRVKCLSKELEAMSLAKTWTLTARSVIKWTNHEATVHYHPRTSKPCQITNVIKKKTPEKSVIVYIKLHMETMKHIFFPKNENDWQFLLITLADKSFVESPDKPSTVLAKCWNTKLRCGELVAVILLQMKCSHLHQAKRNTNTTVIKKTHP